MNNQAELKAKEFAQFCIDAGPEMGPYWLDEAANTFYSLATEKYILPLVLNIHELLERMGAGEDNQFDSNDLDDHSFWIPTGDPNHKVWVLRTQNRDYLFVLRRDATMTGDDLSQRLRRYSMWRLDIQRIWRPMTEHKWGAPITSFDAAVLQASSLVDFTDENCNSKDNCFIKRPGLEFFRSIRFKIPYVGRHKNIYGDCRDAGYILHWDVFRSEFHGTEHVDRGKADMLMNSALPSVHMALEEAINDPDRIWLGESRT